MVDDKEHAKAVRTKAKLIRQASRAELIVADAMAEVARKANRSAIRDARLKAQQNKYLELLEKKAAQLAAAKQFEVEQRKQRQEAKVLALEEKNRLRRERADAYHLKMIQRGK